jgi:hypothetical protein
MKKIILLLFLITSLSFSLEITSIDPIDFGEVVEGDKKASLTDTGVYVHGKPGKDIEIIVAEIYDLDGNKMTTKPREKIVKLDDNGNGKFVLDIEVELKNNQEYKTITDNMLIKVKYVD